MQSRMNLPRDATHEQLDAILSAALARAVSLDHLIIEAALDRALVEKLVSVLRQCGPVSDIELRPQAPQLKAWSVLAEAIADGSISINELWLRASPEEQTDAVAAAILDSLSSSSDLQRVLLQGDPNSVSWSGP